MCFEIKEHVAHVAEEDIEVFKLGYSTTFENEFNSSVREFFYAVGEVQEKVKLLVQDHRSKIDRLSVELELVEAYIDRGYHSYNEFKLDLFNLYEGGVGTFVIPKGSTYYQNETERVSDCIVFKGWIHFPKSIRDELAREANTPLNRFKGWVKRLFGDDDVAGRFMLGDGTYGKKRKPLMDRIKHFIETRREPIR